ncbi:MAG: MFS transporter [Planctomycetes bacterium]|nr:MFS transporter [Planctomycetota bacterium]
MIMEPTVPKTQPQPRPQLGALFLTLFIDLVGFSIIFPLLPAMLDYYFAREGAESIFGKLLAWLAAAAAAPGQDPNGLYTDWRVQTLFGGVLGSIYSLLQFICSPVWGSLSDRHGRRPILLITIAGLLVSYLLWAFSGSFLLFVLSRMLGGVMSGNISAATAAIADTTSRAERAKGMAVIGIAFGLGFIVGPAIGGALSLVDLTALIPGAAAWGVSPFSAAALGAALLALANLAWVAARFRETHPPERRGPPAELRTANPLRLFGARDGREIQRTQIAYFVFLVAFSGMEFTLTFLVRERFRWDPVAILWMFVFIGAVLVLVQGGLVRRLAPRFGEKRVAFAGLALIIPGLVLVALAAGTGVLYAGLGLMAAGSALAIPTLTSMVSLFAPAERQGAVLGVFRSLGALARAVGPFAAAAAFWSFGAAAPYLSGAALLAIPLLLLAAVPQPARDG